jgi:M6 family metalloprotease-like protein
MKKMFTVMIGISFFFNLNAIKVKNMSRLIVQPDGTKIECYITGDEFGGMIHDAEGFAIKRDQKTGWWKYVVENEGQVICTEYKVGKINPKEKGLKKGIFEFNTAFYKSVTNGIQNNKRKFQVSGGILKSTNSAMTINSIIIFVRFNGANGFAYNHSHYEPYFNSTNQESLKNYIQEVSYDNLDVNSTFYPVCSSDCNLSYEDTYTRDYFIKYPEESIGYNGDSERESMEHGLVKRAVDAISSEVPTNINLDADNDGNVDHVCIIVQGGSADVYYGDLLWPHKWTLHSEYAYINSKRVYDYTLLNTAVQFSEETICHEFLHVVGMPDNYHNPSNNPDLEPTGYWDIMGDLNGNFPHPGAYLKYEYAGWINSIPEITSEGTYSLNPITSSSNNCYKIKSPYNCDEYYLVEYRKRSGNYENTLEGDGLIVYRINPNGNNYSGPYDEVYIYRPNGTLTMNGNPEDANFSNQEGRTSINDLTNPCSFLKTGNPGGLRISEISSSGTSISFKVTFPFSISGPYVVCNSNTTYSIINGETSGRAFSWDCDSGVLTQVGNDNGSSNVVKANSSSTDGEGWITAKIVAACGDTITRTIPVWVGKPVLDASHFIITSADAGNWYSCTNQTGNLFDISYFNDFCGCTNYEIEITNLSNTYTYYQFYTSGGYGNLDFPNLAEGWYLFRARGYNSCGWGEWTESEIEFVDCSQMRLQITPNPSYGEATVSIVTGSSGNSTLIGPILDQNNEWTFEVYDNRLNLIIHRENLKGNSTLIQATKWKEGVYIARVYFRNKILSGKFIVKK